MNEIYYFQYDGNRRICRFKGLPPCLATVEKLFDAQICKTCRDVGSLSPGTHVLIHEGEIG